jgi:hypothetical protein
MSRQGLPSKRHLPEGTGRQGPALQGYTGQERGGKGHPSLVPGPRYSKLSGYQEGAPWTPPTVLPDLTPVLSCKKSPLLGAVTLEWPTLPPTLKRCRFQGAYLHSPVNFFCPNHTGLHSPGPGFHHQMVALEDHFCPTTGQGEQDIFSCLPMQDAGHTLSAR